MLSLGDIVAHFKADTTNFTAGVSGVMASLGSITGIAATIGGAIAGIFAVDKIIGFGQQAISLAGDMEQTRTAFTNMLGSAEAAQAKLDEMKAFAAATPFEFTDLVRASQRMMALGFSIEEVIPNLRAIGDAAAYTGQGAEAIDRIVYALGQMRNSTRVNAQDMNQLINAQIPAWQILADAAGKSIAQIKQDYSKGTQDMHAIVDTLIAGMNTRFGGMMSQQSATFKGRLSTLKDEIGFTLTAMGEAFLPVVGKAVEALFPLLEQIKNWAVEMSTNLKPALEAVAEKVAAFILAVSSGHPFIDALWNLLSSVGTFLSAIFKPAVDNLVAAITSFFSGVSQGSPLLDTLAGLFTNMASVLGPLIKILYDVLAPILSLVAAIAGPVLIAALMAISAQFQAFGELLAFVKPAIDAVVASFVLWIGSFKTLIEWISKIPGVKTAFASLSTSVNDTSKKFEELEKPVVANLAAFKKYGPELPKVKDKIKDLGGEVKKTKENFEVLNKAQIEWALKLSDQAEKTRLAKIQVEAWNKAWEDGTAEEELNKVTTALRGMSEQVHSTTVPAFAAMKLGSDESSKSMGLLTDSYKTFGITAPADLQKTADKYEEMRDAILADPDAGEQAKNTAIYKALEAQAAYMASIGQTLPEAQRKLMDDLKGAIDEKKETVQAAFESPFKDAFKAVENAVTQSVGNVVDILTGQREGSVLSELKHLGINILEAFVNPFQTAISNLINGAIKDLIGALTGDGGILGSLHSVGSALGGIFGGAGDKAGGTAADVAGGVPGIPGAGGAAGGVGGALTGWASGLISGVIGAIGSVIGAAMMGGDLGNIEENTRKAHFETANIRTDNWSQHNGLMGKLDNVWNSIIDKGDMIATRVWDVRDVLSQSILPVGEDARNHLQQLLGFSSMQVDHLNRLNHGVDTLSSTITQAFNVYGASAEDVASKIAAKLRTQNLDT